MNYRKVDALLKEKHISKRELAKLLNMQENTLTAAFRRKSKKTFSDQVIMDIAHYLDVPFYDIIDVFDQNEEINPKKLTPEREAEFYDAGLTLALTENDQLKKQYGISLISKEDEEAIMKNNYDVDVLLRVYSRFEVILLIQMINSLTPNERAATFKFLKDLKNGSQSDKKEEE